MCVGDKKSEGRREEEAYRKDAAMFSDLVVAGIPGDVSCPQTRF